MEQKNPGEADSVEENLSQELPQLRHEMRRVKDSMKRNRPGDLTLEQPTNDAVHMRYM